MLNNLIAPQIEYLLAIQNFREITNGLFDNFFIFITAFGEINIPILAICGIYWCINKRYGMYILWTWCLGFFIAELIKLGACVYRPWILDTRIEPIPSAMKMAGGYSFPSAHTQTAISVWGGIAVCFKNRILRTILILLIILVAFSRNYLGVHTLQDITVPFIIGTALLFGVKKLFNWSEKGKNRDIIIYIGIISACCALGLYSFFKTYPTDYINGCILVDPEKMKMYTLPNIGLILGTFTGYFFSNRFIIFNPEAGTIKEKFFRYLIGIFLLIIIFSGTKYILEPHIEKSICISITAFIIFIFITLIYPAIITIYKNFSINNRN